MTNLEKKRAENKKIALEKINTVAKALNMKPEDLTKWRKKMNIVFLDNNSEKGNFVKSIEDDTITIENVVENWVSRSIITVPDNYQNSAPWYFCFQLDEKWTKQAVAPTWNMWKNSKIILYAYCFWMEKEVIHWDWKIYNLDEWSHFEIYEFNFNKYWSSMRVDNVFTANVWKNAYFKNHYESTTWNLWIWNTRWTVNLNWENSKADFVTKNKILDWDSSKLNIKFNLNWKNSSWLMLSKSVTFEWWKNYFKWTMVWEWANTSWHIDCSEISMWKCEIETIPSLKVLDPSSRLTHEAAVWTLERKSIENLMIKWFSEDEAIQFMVNGVLD